VSDRLIDAQLAGELLDVPKSWLLEEARHDRVPHIRLGKYVRFDADQLLAWARGRARGPLPLHADNNQAAPATLERPGA
jgi:hypothetical protein